LDSIPLTHQHHSLPQFILPTFIRPTPIISITPTAPDVTPWAKSFSYACRRCKNTDHWTKDCPHCFDVHYLSVDKLQKALNDKRVSAGLPPLGPLKPKNNTVNSPPKPLGCSLSPSPDPKPPSTLFSPKENSLHTPNPLGVATFRDLALGWHLSKEGVVMGVTLSLSNLLSHLIHHAPTLCPVDAPYIPPDLLNPICPRLHLAARCCTPRVTGPLLWESFFCFTGSWEKKQRQPWHCPQIKFPNNMFHNESSIAVLAIRPRIHQLPGPSPLHNLAYSAVTEAPEPLATGPNQVIPTITLTFPGEDLVDPRILVQTTLYTPPTQPHHPSPLQWVVCKASTIFEQAFPIEENFIAPLSWSSPLCLPHLPFILKFPSSKVRLRNSSIAHLGQQIQCITFYYNLVDKMLSDAAPEPKRYQYLTNSRFWYDLCPQASTGLYFQFWLPRGSHNAFLICSWPPSHRVDAFLERG